MTTLNQTYFYQNSKTNQPSSSTLSSKQLCRILCPTASSSSSSIIRSDTLVVEYDPVTNQYDTNQGWVPISSISLFQCVSSEWYYSCREQKEQDKGSTGTSTGSNDTSTGTKESKAEVKGPISCRELASLYYQNPPIINDETSVWSSSLATIVEAQLKEEKGKEGQEEGEGESSQTSSTSTSTSTSTSWKSISELSLLKLAMEAFHDVVGNASFFTNNDTTNQNEQDMVYNDGDDNENGNENQETKGKDKQEKEEHDLLLEEFLSSTGGSGGVNTGNTGNNDEDEEEEEEYESDGGTKYVKVNNKWVDSKTINPFSIKSGKKRPLPTQAQEKSIQKPGEEITTMTKKKKKRTKPKFSTKNAKHWVYVTNLPTDTNEIEVANYFSKVGILDIDPETQRPKIKLYRHQHNKHLKGDASICYAKIESVHLSLQLLDDTIFRTIDPNTNQPLDYEVTKKQQRISVQQAKFEQKTEADMDSEYLNKTKKKKSSISEKKRQVARIAKLQAITWDEGDYNGRITGGIKGLRIIVLKHIFTLRDIQMAKKKGNMSNMNKNDTSTNNSNGEDEFLESIEHKIRKECEGFGIVEKITIFSKNADGVVIVKFAQPTSASDAIQFYNGSMSSNNNNKKNIEASYWDGDTDYTVRDEVQEEAETKERHDQFGNWLDQQELPEEFQLNVES